MFKKSFINGSMQNEDDDRYEGYCIDLLKKIAKIANFTYGKFL